MVSLRFFCFEKEKKYLSMGGECGREGGSANARKISKKNDRKNSYSKMYETNFNVYTLLVYVYLKDQTFFYNF